MDFLSDVFKLPYTIKSYTRFILNIRFCNSDASVVSFEKILGSKNNLLINAQFPNQATPDHVGQKV